MRTTSRVLRGLASGLLVLLALGGGLFAAGYAVSDLPLFPVILGITLWVAAAAGLGWLALRRTDVAVPTLLAVSVGVAALAVLDGRLNLFERDTNGPVMTIIVLAAIVPMALLGLHRATEAGLMLLLVGLAQLLGSGLLHSAGDGAMWRQVLGGSSGVVVLPILLGALLLLVAGRMDHERVSFWHHPHAAQPAH